MLVSFPVLQSLCDTRGSLFGSPVFNIMLSWWWVFTSYKKCCLDYTQFITYTPVIQFLHNTHSVHPSVILESWTGQGGCSNSILVCILTYILKEPGSITGAALPRWARRSGTKSWWGKWNIYWKIMEYAGIKTTSRKHIHKFFPVVLAAALLLAACATPLLFLVRLALPLSVALLSFIRFFNHRYPGRHRHCSASCIYSWRDCTSGASNYFLLRQLPSWIVFKTFKLKRWEVIQYFSKTY